MVLCGSPRKKGNTNRLVTWFTESATEAGASVETIDTTRLDYKNLGCIACMGCRSRDEYECVVDDGARPLLKRIPETDVLVMATPVYWFAPTAQLKVFTDRMFSLVKSNPETGEMSHSLGGKTLALIATAGGDLNDGLNCVDLTFSTAARFLNMKYDSLLVPFAPLAPADIEKDDDLRKRVKDFGRQMAEGGTG
jgi:multimeric flavodoxin WrbA